MDISGLGSLFGSQDLTEIERLRRERESKGALGSLGWNSDTVSISEEGRRLAEEMQARRAEALKLQDTDQDAASLAAHAAGISGQDGEARAGSVPDAPSGAGGAQSGGDGSSQVESIKKQIEQLKAKMQSVASSALPEEVKASTVAAYQAQISELESQMQELQRG
ncbi:MAG: FlxA-like family protein [Desulfovibrionaceae bacterium]|nr:FlxA-like family protein [Desulfovibrionaceae bacterium]